MVTRRIQRKDGIVQRYNVKHLKVFKEEYVYNNKKKHWEHKPDYIPPPPPPPPPPPKDIWRMTLTINYVVHHEYRSMRLQRWAKTYNELKNELPSAWKRLRDSFERKMGYSLNFIQHNQPHWYNAFEEGEDISRDYKNTTWMINREEITDEGGWR